MPVFFGLAFLLVVLFYRESSARSIQELASLAAGGASLASLWLLALTLFVIQFTDSTFGPLLPLYLGVLGAPAGSLASLIGVAVSLASLGAAAAAFAAPRLARQHATGAMRLFLLGATLACLPVGAATFYWQLLPAGPAWSAHRRHIRPLLRGRRPARGAPPARGGDGDAD